MIFSKGYIDRIAKKNCTIDFELISTLDITKNEAIILDHISYFNNAYGAISIQITKFAQMLQISRAHLYRCLKKLTEKDLICKHDNNEIEVTERYKQTKTTCFNNAHQHKKISKKHVKSAENRNEEILNNLSQNETNASQNETLTSIYNTNTLMCVNNTHKEYINDCCHNRQQIQQDLSLVELLEELLRRQEPKQNECLLREEKYKELCEVLKDDEKASKEVTANEAIYQSISQKDLQAVREFSVILGKTGMFLLKENKEAFLKCVENLVAQQRDISAMIAYSMEHNCLWICENGEDRVGVECLKKVWSKAAEKIQTQNTNAIATISQKYRSLLLQFLQYREQKGRKMNEFALKRLCLTLRDLELKGISIADSISQSIERGYNWVFKPTNKANYRYYRRKQKTA